MRKTLGLYLFGIFAIASGIGCMSASFFNKTAAKAEAKEDLLAFNDGVAVLGRYPQTITDADVEAIKSGGTVDPFTGWYSYQNKQYAIRTVQLDEEYLDLEKFNDGSEAKTINGSEKAFLVEDLKWEILATGSGYADLITTRIIDRQIYSSFGDWYPMTTLKEFNNTTFLSSAFSEDEKAYLQDYQEDEYTYKVNLPEESQASGYADEKLEYPSDYAIASTLSGNPEGGETYVNGPYWTRTFSMRVTVVWSGEHQTACLIDDPKIGVRPVIRVAYETTPVTPQGYIVSFDANGGSGKMDDVTDVSGDFVLPECAFTAPEGKVFSNWEANKKSYNPGEKISVTENVIVKAIWKDKESGGGGGGSAPTPAPTGGGSGNITLGLGIAFTVVGAGGLIAFFVIWSKKGKSSKPPIWIIVSLAGSLVISVAGLGCLGGGIKGGASGTVVGWYQGNMYDCVAWGERLAMNLTRDGKVYRYVADAWDDSAVNYKFILQPGVGSYSYGGGKLTITAASEWKLSSWETPVMTYTDCHGLGSFLKYEGYSGTAYSWYHYSNIDSNGIAEIRNNDTKDLKWA